MRDQLLLFIGG